jgi:hypothetical protein
VKTTRSIEILFLLAALYDGGLGAAFLITPALVFRMGNVTPPNHWAYVQFPAALLLIFGLMFVAIARNPIKNKDLMIYGILLKLSYSGITIGYWLAEGIPGLWKPFAVADLMMAALFVWSYKAIGASSHSES